MTTATPAPEPGDVLVIFGITGDLARVMTLHAAPVGDDNRFGRQDGGQERWRVMQPLVDSPPPVLPYAKGTWGPGAADDA